MTLYLFPQPLAVPYIFRHFIGLSLEKMDELFGVTNLVQRKEEEIGQDQGADPSNKAAASHVERAAV